MKLKEKEFSWCEVDFGLSKNQRLEVDDEFNSYFFMRIVQFYVDNIFVQRTELWLILKTIWFDAAFARIVLYLPLNFICPDATLIPTQWDTVHAVHLVGRLCTTHKKMKAYFVKKTVEPGVSEEVKY